MKQRDGVGVPRPAPGSEVKVRRDENSGTAIVEFNRLRNVKWTRDLGGHAARAEKLHLAASVWCNELHDVDGSFHSGTHGRCPHSITVVILEEDNDVHIFDKVSSGAKWPGRL